VVDVQYSVETGPGECQVLHQVSFAYTFTTESFIDPFSILFSEKLNYCQLMSTGMCSMYM
jgi:hypothetical protein